MSQPVSLPASIPASPSLPTTPSFEPWLARLMAGMGEANGQPMMMSGCSITTAERHRLEAMVEGTRRRLTPQPGERKMVAVILAKLLAAFPAQSQSEAPAAQRVEAYFEALADVPMLVVDKARQEIITGRAPECSGTWAPTPPQVAMVCRRLMQDERANLAKLERLLAAKPYDQIDLDERERVSAGLDKLVADLAAMVKAA